MPANSDNPHQLRPILDPALSDLMASCRYSVCDEAMSAGLGYNYRLLPSYICTARGHVNEGVTCALLLSGECRTFAPWLGHEKI